MNDELRTALEAERGAWHEFYAERVTAGELEAACAATDAAVAALRAEAAAADRVRELADHLEADNRRWPDAPVVGLRADLADRIRRALDGNQS